MSGIMGPLGVVPITAATPPPDAYLSLLAAFGGDADALALYVGDLTGWATGSEAQAVLDAAQVVGDPDAALLYFGDRPVVMLTEPRPELDRPFYDLNIQTSGAVITGSIEMGTSF